MLRRFIPLVLVAAIAFYGYEEYSRRAGSGPVTETFSAKQMDSTSFQCDGRTHCSQMTSCAEATYFLRNCPGTKMDGDGDGVPCEAQWCGDRTGR